MNIAGLVKTSTIDYSGKLSCVIFTAGCNYDCGYCHNRALLSAPPLLDEEAIFAFLKKRAHVLEGVVISGGEPTIQHDLFVFAAKIKEIGYCVKLDTNGSNPEALGRLLQNSVIDYVALDYKAPLKKYPDICKHDATGVQECMEIMHRTRLAWEVRTTLIPQLDANDLTNMAKNIPQIPLYALQRYRPINDAEQNTAYRQSQIYRFAKMIKRYQPNTIVRG